MRFRNPSKAWLPVLVALITALAVACAGAATPPDPTQAVTSEATPTSAPAVSGPTPTPTVGPTVTPLPSDIVSAQDSLTLVVGEEPIQLNSFRSVGAALNTPIVKDNLVETLTWQSGDDQRIVPTGATTGWEQLAPNKWRFNLRQGVKFHNGEAWNAEAALPSLAYLGVGANDNSSFPYTGGFSAEAVDEYTLDITCDQPCPIFPNTSIFVTFEAPNYLNTTPDPDWARQSIGFGPYQLVEWRPGVDITEEAYEDYAPAGDHYEFQKPFIKNLRWLWRGEPTVMIAMVDSGEADIAWDVGVDASKALPETMIKSGSSAETFALTVNTLCIRS